jgi:integrase
MPRRGRNEGSIFRRQDGRWVGSVTLDPKGGRRQRRSFYGRTRAEVAGKLRQAQGKLDENLPLPPAKGTLEAHLKTWLSEKKRTLRPDTYRRYNDLVRLYIVPQLGRIRLAKLTIEDVQALHKSLEGRVSGTTGHHCHGVLHAALQDALRWGLVSRNVASLVSAPRRSTGEMRVLSVEDAKDLLTAARGDRLEALFVLALTAGLREGELQALRWRDVALERHRLTVVATLTTIVDGEPVFGEPKTQHSKRTVWLGDTAVESLRAHRRRQEAEQRAASMVWREHGLVFTNELGAPLWRSQIRKPFLEVVRKAGLDHLRFHDLRHSAASLLLQQGTPIKVVSELLGHSDVGTTLRVYAHTIPGMQEQAASAMDRLLHS